MKNHFPIAILFAGLSLCRPCLAQQETGSIAGQITDPSGAAVAGARVTIANRGTGGTFESLTDTGGNYRDPQLAPGAYDITVAEVGFSTLVREAVEVRVADRLRIDLTLQVGSLNEKVLVKAETPLLQTEDATTGQVIDNQRVTELPLNGRNWLQLATLAPATVTYPGVVDTGAGNSQNVVMNLGGAATNQTNYLLNGADNTMFLSSGGALVYPPVDSLQEFKVQTNNYTADSGRLGGAIVNATIKSGSNAYHGSAYEFLRNRELNALNFFAVPQQSKPEFTRNQFGASVGGPFLPFLKNKLLFFLNYEGTRQRQDQIVTTQVYSDSQKAGNFASQLGAQVGVDALGRPVVSGQIFDPFSVQRLANGTAIRDPFPGNIIPVSRINPVSKALIDLVPPANTTGSPNFVRDLSAPLNIDIFVGRIDWLQSSRDTVASHFIYSDQHSYTAPILGLPLDGGNAQNFQTSNQRQFGLGWTHVFRPTDLNEFRLSYVRNASLRESEQSNTDLNAQFGIPFAYLGPHIGGLANLGITGYASIGTASSTPFFQYVNKYELTDSYTAVRGSHTLKFGVRGSLKLFENQLNNNNGRGVLTFNGVFTSQIGFNNTGSSVADFLTGVVNTATVGSVTHEKDIGHDISWYVQDKWQASRKLTLTIGLRYDYNPPDWEARDLISSVTWGQGLSNPTVIVPKGQDETTFQFMKNVVFPFIPVRRADELDRGLVHNTYLNFAPRLGIAYQLTPHTVLRTGYGIFYGFPDILSGAVLTVNPPSKVQVSASSNTIDPTLLLNQSIFGPNPFNRALTNPNFFSVRNPRMPPQLTQMYNLSIQHQFGAAWLLEAGFMGNRNSRVYLIKQMNDAIPALPTDTSSPQSRRIVSTLLGNLPQLTPEGFSNYNALTLNLEKRFSQGLSLLANYTWSRALGVAPAVTEGINNTSIQNPLDLKREYGPLEFDIVNRVTISYIYELPLGKGKAYLRNVSKTWNQLVGGWQLNGITTLQGGFPITPVLGTSLGKTFTNSRPDAIGDPTKTARQPYAWINPAAFATPTNSQIAAGDFFGNTGWGSIREPGLVNFDFSLSKAFVIREDVRLQFRTEVFNLTNTPFFGRPSAVGTTFGTPTFGKVTLAGDPRVLQFGLRLVF